MFRREFARWIYGVSGIPAALFIWKMAPETKGHALGQVAKPWSGHELRKFKPKESCSWIGN